MTDIMEALMKLCTLLALGGLFVACDDTTFTGGGGGAPIQGNDFCSVETIFEDECLGCHSSGSALGNLDLETDAYAALVNVTASVDSTQQLVIPGDAANSLLYTMMAGIPPNGLSPMPKGGNTNAGYAQVVETWINDGADACGNEPSDSEDDTATEGGEG
jgi:hypothetical protein